MRILLAELVRSSGFDSFLMIHVVASKSCGVIREIPLQPLFEPFLTAGWRYPIAI